MTQVRAYYAPHGMWTRDKKAMRRAQGNRCALCGQIFGTAKDSFEHVVPRSRGGGHVGNLVVTHFSCNQQRGNASATGCLLIWLDVVNARLAA